MDNLVEGVLAGNRRALARLLTHIENQTPQAQAALSALYPQGGKAWIIGITGAPGTGKSSLVNALALAYRAQGKTVAILAVDPTSPFSGGAILGDRIRMRDLSGDAGVFIRSMATRGSLGGLSRATRDAVRVLDAAGYDLILVETVGAGQSEVDIVRTAYTTVVVEAPGLGDDVQAIKAGILEIADVLVVNKADRPGATNTVRALRAMLELGHPVARDLRHHGQMMAIDEHAEHAPSADFWLPPVIETVTLDKRGIPELLDAIQAHRHYLQSEARWQARVAQNLQIELVERLREALLERIMARLAEQSLPQMLERLRLRQIDPHSAVAALLAPMD